MPVPFILFQRMVAVLALTEQRNISGKGTERTFSPPLLQSLVFLPGYNASSKAGKESNRVGGERVLG